MKLRTALAAILFLSFVVVAAAETLRFSFATEGEMDRAGMELRKAVTEWQRAAGGVRAALANDPSVRTPKITGHVRDRYLTVESPSLVELRFCGEFVRALQAGKTPEESRKQAMNKVPPSSARTEDAAGGGVRSYDREDVQELPYSAVVTLHSVTGKSAALRELESSFNYRSDGRPTTDPRVTARGGGDGLEVEIGNAGDRLSARLRALEANGSLKVDSSTLTRVPLGGDANMSIFGNRQAIDIYIAAQRAGNGAFLDIELDNADSSGAGNSTRTRVRVTNSKTITLSKYEASRTEEYSSGVPLARDLPWVGSLFENSRSTSEFTSHALYATIELE